MDADLTRSLATQSVAPTRRLVVLRSNSTQWAATTRPVVLVRFKTTRPADGNTAYGSQALYSNLTSSTPDAFGNTVGEQNTAVGYQALLSNTTGTPNTAVGFQALASNTTGAFNTAIGVQALYSHTDGANNSAFGFQALYSYNSSGFSNLAVGAAALTSLMSGESNTAVGTASLTNTGNSGGIVNFNTALGRRALFRTQGNQNIGLGFFAGSNLNDGGNNILIGNVRPVPIGSESNTIRIGTQIPGYRDERKSADGSKLYDARAYRHIHRRHQRRNGYRYGSSCKQQRPTRRGAPFLGAFQGRDQADEQGERSDSRAQASHFPLQEGA